MKPARVPATHELGAHGRLVSCACASAEDLEGGVIIVCTCGAAYRYADVATFPYFRCSDCGASRQAGGWRIVDAGQPAELAAGERASVLVADAAGLVREITVFGSVDELVQHLVDDEK